MRLKYTIPLADPLINEEEAKSVFDVVKSGWIREGEFVNQFEKKIAGHLGVKYAIAVSSGTAAIHVALACLNLEKGDEVILPSFTCAPPVSMILLLGGVPSFADIETQTYNIDPESVKRMISKKTKVIIPINYAGHPAEFDTLQEIADDNNIYLLNDAAEALGATYYGKNIAKFGNVVTFSFSPNKTITTGEGGMIVTNNEEIAEKAKIIKDYGQQDRFHYVELGNNYRMTEMQAAMGLIQLKKIKKILDQKRANAKLLTEKLSEIKEIATPVEFPNCTHAYCLYTIRVLSKKVDRDQLMKELEEEGIQTRVYFPPMHMSPMMNKFRFRNDRLVNTEGIASAILSLPSSPKLSQANIECVYEAVRSAFNR